MATRYRCPNPVCTHEFDPAQLVGVASVTCPLCGMVIQLRAAPAAAPPPAAPTAQPVAPVAPQPVAEPSDGTPILRTRKVARGRDWVTYSVLIGLFLILVGLGVGAAVRRMADNPGITGGNEPMNNTDLNVSFEAPGSAWERNNNLRDKMPVALLAFQRGDNTWFALDARDFKDHDPSPQELDDEARTRLKGYFQNIETEPGRGTLTPGDAVAGQPTNVIIFQGEIDGEHVAGEVHSFHFQGIGYWTYAWKKGTVDARHDDDFPKMRKRVGLLGDRTRWNELQQHRKEFTGNKVPGYSLTDTTGRWKVEENPEEHDPAADLVLFAPDPKAPRYARSQGVFLIVMSIPKKDDAVAAAREHILAKQKRDSYDMAKIADANEDGTGSKDSLGGTKGRLLRWRIDLTSDLAHFALVGVVSREKDILILYGECDWSKRNTWEGQLQAIMETVKVE
ncbi:MAG: hypothetical protein ACJ8F7_07305 [Gemmataceae bacterium]